jgi:hypothetical protein
MEICRHPLDTGQVRGDFVEDLGDPPADRIERGGGEKTVDEKAWDEEVSESLVVRHF